MLAKFIKSSTLKVMSESRKAPEYGKVIEPDLKQLGATALSIYELSRPTVELPESAKVWFKKVPMSAKGDEETGYTYLVTDGSYNPSRVHIEYLTGAQRKKLEKSHLPPSLSLDVDLVLPINKSKREVSCGFAWDIRGANTEPKEFPESIPVPLLGIVQGQLDFLYEAVREARQEALQTRLNVMSNRTTMVLGD